MTTDISLIRNNSVTSTTVIIYNVFLYFIYIIYIRKTSNTFSVFHSLATVVCSSLTQINIHLKHMRRNDDN